MGKLDLPLAFLGKPNVWSIMYETTNKNKHNCSSTTMDYFYSYFNLRLVCFRTSSKKIE